MVDYCPDLLGCINRRARGIQEPDSEPKNQLLIAEEQVDGQFIFSKADRCNLTTYQNIQPLPKLVGISVKMKMRRSVSD